MVEIKPVHPGMWPGGEFWCQIPVWSNVILIESYIHRIDKILNMKAKMSILYKSSHI